MTITDCAAALAKRLHEGQKDKAGMDYFEGHLTTVASGCDEMECKCCAYLHDAAEDTPYSEVEILSMLEEEIAKNGLSPLDKWQRRNIADALHRLNHNNYPSREAYIEGFRGDAMAIRVKIADLKHNMDITRIPDPTEKDFARVKRYEKELALLQQWYDDPNTGL